MFKNLYAIRCTLQVEQGGPFIPCLAICTDPDTPETFINADGRPIPTPNGVWSYKLLHHAPWGKYQIIE